MIDTEIYVSRFSAWAPGMGSWTLSNHSEWDEWAQGRRSISFDAKGPELTFTDAMFRRRLSQIAKMTVQVIHDLLPLEDDTKICFCSFRGELARQYQINKMLIEEKELSPAAFSLSVFNAPVALASIALGLKGGYSAIYPAGKNAFAAGLAVAEASLCCDTAQEMVFVYADEQAPPEYAALSRGFSPPAAFGLLLSREPGRLSVPLSSLEGGDGSPLDFLKRLLHGAMYASP